MGDEQQIERVLRRLETAVEPDDRFADQLYARLAADAGFARTPGRHWWGSWRLSPVPTLLWLVVALVALGAVVLGIAVAGSPRPSALQLVERSQAAFLAPPPFALMTRFSDGTEARYLFNGDALRIDVTKGPYKGELPKGTVLVDDSTRTAVYEPDRGAWTLSDHPSGLALSGLEPSWIAPVAWPPGAEPPLATCDGWEPGPETRVANRIADEVRCGEDRYWIDRETALLLRRDLADPGVADAEAIALETGADLAPELFAVDASPVPGIGEPALRPTSRVLAAGKPAPSWSGPLLGGGAFSTTSLVGRPSAVFLWCACVWGPQPRIFLEEARARAGSANLVLVSMDGEATTRGVATWVGAESPIVLDQPMDLLATWGLDAFPALVLFRADGSVADIHPATFDATSLHAIIDAVASGAPVPDPLPRPTPSVEPGSEMPLSTVLREGEPAPDLDGPLLGGGVGSTGALVGKPTVVLHWQPRDAGAAPPDDAPGPERLLAELRAHQDAVNVLLVAHGEPTTGAVERFLTEQGASFPVMFDWDGSLKAEWGLWQLPTLVLLDAEGRVAAVRGQEGLTAPGPLLDALDAGTLGGSSAP